jgi:integrase
MGFPFGPLFKVLLLTGQRIGEVSGMRWRDVDLEKMVWTLPKSMTKNKEPHTVPLSNQVAEVLKTLPRIGDEFAFTTTGVRPISGFSKAKSQIDAAAEVAGWRWHDLRRTFATYAAEQLEVQQAVTEAILNHKSGSTAGVSGVYNRARYTRQKTEALQAWANLLDRITGASDANNVLEMR